MVDVTKYNIYRVPIKNITNAWHETIFYKDQILHCTHDVGMAFFAKPILSDAIPRVIEKADCRVPTNKELEEITDSAN